MSRGGEQFIAVFAGGMVLLWLLRRHEKSGSGLGLFGGSGGGESSSGDGASSGAGGFSGGGGGESSGGGAGADISAEDAASNELNDNRGRGSYFEYQGS